MDSNAPPEEEQHPLSRQLNQARVILIIVGVLTLGVNGFLLNQSAKEIDDVLDEEIVAIEAEDQDMDEDALAEFRADALLGLRMVYSTAVGVGIVYLALATLVFEAPVPATLTGLLLYVGSTAFFYWLDPTTIMRGVVVKALIVFGLFRSWRSAVAFAKAPAS